MKVRILARDGFKIVRLNRRRAIRERCFNCSCWNIREVQVCKFGGCPLFPFRSGKGPQNAAARAKSIQAFCVWCMAGEKAEVRKCVSVHCPLYLFRRRRVEKAIPIFKNAHGEAFFEAISLD
jgi:hypothetical protein